MSPISRLYHSVIYWTPIFTGPWTFSLQTNALSSRVYVCVFNVTNALAKQSLFYHANKAVERNSRGRKRRESKKESCFSFVLALWRQSLSSCVLILDGQMRLQATPDVFGERERERERERVTGRFSDLPPGGWFHLFLSRCSVSCLLREALTRAALAAELQKIAGERGTHTDPPTTQWLSDEFHYLTILFIFSLHRSVGDPHLSWALSLSLSLSLIICSGFLAAGCSWFWS